MQPGKGKIEAYSFGRMTIDGKEYTSDLIIYPDGRIQDAWRRKEGHELALEDIRALVDAAPEVIVVGSGASGLMEPNPHLAEELETKGIALEVLPSKKAMERYNSIRGDKKKVAACFHLTC